jgi:PAS domain S-box-containing protein
LAARPSIRREAAYVLLVDDKPENLLALEAILGPLGHGLVRARSGEEALNALSEQDFALILLDMRMPGLSGLQTALEIQKSPRARRTPIIFLTANDSPAEIAEAYAHGAVDFLSKPLSHAVLKAKVSVFVELFEQRSQIDQHEVERLLLQKREEELLERNHLLGLEAEVAAALGSYLALQPSLSAVSEALVRHLGAAFARIWTVDDDRLVLELQASAGIYTHLNGPHARVRVGENLVGKIAALRRSHVTNQVVGDVRVGDREWARRTGMVAFAGYPMLVGDRLIGVIALFARHPLSRAALDAIQSVAAGVARAVERLRAEERLRASETWLATTLSGIGDGVIAADAGGRVSYLNPVAESLTGWTAAEATGRSLDDIFRIVDEDTRTAVESPITKVLHEGANVGIAGHTLLLRRDGTEIPIDDSTAPIRATTGELRGVVLVFRDASEKRRTESERARLLEEARNARSHAEQALREAAQLNETLGQTEQVLRSLLDNLPELAWSALPDGFIDFYNQRWFEYTGTTPEDMKGWGWQRVHDPVLLPKVVERWTHSIATGELFEMEFPIRAANGEFEWFLTRVRPLRDGAGQIVRWFGTNTNIHHQRELARKAEEASLAKDGFLATASHELRTPLNAILGWAQLLRSGQLDPSGYLRAVETIERNAHAQVRLIEDILDGSRIITGKLHLEIRQLDLTGLVRAALDAVRPAADAKNIGLTVVLDPAAAQMTGDPERLQQVIWNLANNAIKFTPKGGLVEVRLERIGTSVELTLKDSGHGIGASFLPQVFERFRQADGRTTRRHGGLGLGLALVRHLVEAHGGTVRAESEGEGLGSTFIVTLPSEAVFAEEAEPERRGNGAVRSFSMASVHGVTVLVVDDEADVRDLVATILRTKGAEVTTAANADQAMELMLKTPPMVLISDIGMPGRDGYELVRELRKQPGSSGAQVPAIALTAYAREEDRRLALEAGFQVHLVKPVEPAELLRVVSGLVQYMSRQSSPGERVNALQRADMFLKFERLLEKQGIAEALRFLNSRTPHRFTGLYRFDSPMLRSLHLVDSEAPECTKGADTPLEESYCSIVGQTESTFTIEDARGDDRVRTHRAREKFLSYCGVLLRAEDGTPFGTLCHFDVVPCDVPVAEMPLMEAAVPYLMKALRLVPG